MKKIIGIILMLAGGLFFCLLMVAEVKLIKYGNAPTSLAEWIGNLLLPVLSVGIFIVGNAVRKK
ncbi:MAG: hypothetical protein ACI31S_04795 [Bacilli bacterium]